MEPFLTPTSKLCARPWSSWRQKRLTRVRKGGVSHDRATGNLLWGEFTHFTARPEGKTPDPFLHTHVFVFNATKTLKSSGIKAAQLGEIKRNARYYEALYHSKLAASVRELGYGIELREKGWDVSGVPRKLVEKLSKRTTRIEEVARRRGVRSADEKAELGARTRKAKLKELTRAELREAWRAELTPIERAALKAAKLSAGHQMSAREAVESSVRHHFERASVVRTRDILETAAS